jgi:hypothetical protein
LQVINEIAPEHACAEVLSSYFVVAFCGSALPVIGIGVLSTLFNADIAQIVFAATIGLYAIASLVIGGIRGEPAAPQTAQTTG